MDDIGAIQLALKVDYRELTGLVKTADQTKRVLTLVAKDFAKTGNQKNYMKSINQIVKAQKDLDVASRMTRSQIMKLGVKVQQETKFTDSLTLATKKLTAAQMVSGKAIGNTRNKMNGSNMAIQQLGYQFGDFAVQVQGGTSAFVAFSQQGSQLAGILPMIAGPLGLSMGAAVGLSAALGILIPIGSAVGRMFMETAEAGKKSADELKGAFAEVPTFFESLGVSMSASFETAFKKIELDYGKLTGRLARLRVLDMQESGLAMIPSLFESVDTSGFMNALKRTLTFGVEANKLSKEDKKLKDEQSEAIKGIIQNYEHLIRTSHNLDDIGSAVESTSTELHGVSEELGNIFDRAVREQGISATLLKKQLAEETNDLKKKKDALKVFYDFQEAEEKKALESKIRVAEIVKKLKAEEYAGMQGRRGAIAPSKTDVALMGMGGQVTDAGEAEARQAKNRLEAIKHFYKEKAKTEAADLAMAIRIAQIKEEIRQKELASMAAGGGGRGIASPSSIDVALMSMGGVFEETEDKDAEKIKAKTEKLADYIDELKHQKMVEGELVGLFGSERDIKQKTLDIQNEYKNVITVAQEEEIERILRLTDAETKRHEALQKAKEEQEALGASIEASMENAFMSIVDGTASVKDAFKAMAADIIKELFRVLVVKKMVAAVSGGLPFADGGVISNGSQVQAYANGGVVGGPTTFAMSGGKTGLMGEAGPEAIMPLKRGANGKLGVQMEGGGGGTTIVQNINVSTGVQQTVRAEIRQMMPQIADSAKGAVLDAKRRGGSYGRAMA